MLELSKLLRKNIAALKPYTSARDEYKGKEGTFLDANENSFGSATKELHNRYPDPLQWDVKLALAPIKGVKPENILLGNGSDEPIDLLYRCFCNPGVDNVILTPPTYGMYEVSANINDVKIRRVALTPDFQIKPIDILAATDYKTKLIFLCSPNNPTGNHLKQEDIIYVIKNFDGIVVVDEAYIDFSPESTMLKSLHLYPNLVVLQTFSKAWGMANLRLGMAFASQEIINIFNKVKPPYNISGLTQKLALEALKNKKKKESDVKEILIQREILISKIKLLPQTILVYHSDANFILVKTIAGKKIYDYLIANKVIARNRSNVTLCEECLRITVGTSIENQKFLEAYQKFEA